MFCVWAFSLSWLEIKQPFQQQMCHTDYRLANRMFYLEDVVARLHVCDVDPLTVDVMSVSIPAANCDALCSEVGTFVPLLNTCRHSDQF